MSKTRYDCNHDRRNPSRPGDMHLQMAEPGPVFPLPVLSSQARSPSQASKMSAKLQGQVNVDGPLAPMTAAEKATAAGADTAAPIPKGTLDPVYEAKARVLNQAIQDIGMGKYQWQLFAVVGFGWANDNMFPIMTSLILPSVVNEFSSKPPLLNLAQNIGLLVGAMFWGFGCDIFGRRWGFNLTLGVTAVFAMIAASSPNFAAIGCFAALWSFGVGGNLPIDSSIFIEFLPGSHQYLLTVLSFYWAFAQVVATLIAWPLLSNFSCSETEKPCLRSDNMGWRYLVITLGGIGIIELVPVRQFPHEFLKLTSRRFILRFACFTIYESPKFQMGRGNDEKAVEAIHEVARRNGKTSSLTVADLKSCEVAGGDKQKTDAAAAIKRNLEKVNLSHVRALFATPKLAYSTSMIMLIWAFIGLAFPLYNGFLPYIQATRGADFGDGSTYLTYRNTLIVAVLGVPGAFIGALMVEIKSFGRKGTLAIATILTGVFLYGSTTATTSNALLGFQCAWNFCSNIMYAVLYAYTPEIFPTKDRGTGNALTASSNRIFGIMAPIIALFANLETSAPVYVSGALFIAAGVMALLLPFESQGKASL